MAGRVEGKVAFITGAARGQGRAHAIKLASEGADIIAVDVCRDLDTVPYPGATPEDLAETVKLVEALDRRIITTIADVRDLEALTTAAAEGVAELGRLDIVVANAGIATTGTAVDMTEQVWREMLDINLTGVWMTCRAAVPHIIAGGRGGSVIMISSMAGLKGIVGVPHYAAAKHGLVGLMRSMANELAPQSIRVNSVHPTNVDTDMIQNEAVRKLFSPDRDLTKEEFGREAVVMNMLPVPWVEVDDIANAVLFLASDESRYITAITLPVDAGATQK